MAKVFGRVTPAGIAEHPWLSKADTKYNKDGVFKSGLILSEQAAQRLKDEVDICVDEGFEAEIARLGDKKKSKGAVKYYPYTVDEDDQGNATGFICFHFKQNRRINLKEADPKTGRDYKLLNIPMFDPEGKKLKRGAVDIWAGSKLKLQWKPRSIIMKNNDPVKAGVQLQLIGVQVIDLKTGGGSAFSKEEGSFQGNEEMYGSEDPEDYAAEDQVDAGKGDPSAPSEY